MVDEDLGDILNKLEAERATDWKNKGNEYYKQGNFEEALDCYDKALGIVPDYTDALNNKGLSLIKLGRIDEAKACREKITQIQNLKENNQDRPPKNPRGLKIPKPVLLTGIIGVIILMAVVIVTLPFLSNSATQTNPVNDVAGQSKPVPSLPTTVNSPTVQPTTQNPSQISDPLIGSWIEDLTPPNGIKTSLTFLFYPDGSYTQILVDPTVPDSSFPVPGTWLKISDNTYLVTFAADSSTSTFVYNPATDGLTELQYPHIPITRVNRMPSAIPIPTIATAPKPTGTSAPTQPLVLSGSGDDVVSFQATGFGLRIFTMSYTGRDNFIVWLKDGDGNNIDLIANTIGSYSGKKSVQLSTGKYYLDVTATGPWRITITN